jgi:hypothetical protein
LVVVDLFGREGVCLNERGLDTKPFAVGSADVSFVKMKNADIYTGTYVIVSQLLTAKFEAFIIRFYRTRKNSPNRLTLIRRYVILPTIVAEELEDSRSSSSSNC